MIFYDLATTTLGAPSKPVELKIPIWASDGASASTPNTSAGYLNDGSTGFQLAAPSSQNKLHTLSGNWPASTKFAFEVTIWSISASYTAYVDLYDVTSSASVASSQISTTSATATVLRSGNITLTPGHVYAVRGWCSSSGTTYLSDASLIVFP